MPHASLPLVHRPHRSLLLWFIAIGAAIALLWHGPVAQWADYHQFADTRAWHGVLNAANVLSNLPFLLIGLGGLAALLRRRPPSAHRSAAFNAWVGFAAAVALTSAGSSLYHWQPDNTALVFDRLPIAWACATLLCAFLAERVDARWGRPAVLAGMLGLATLSVGWWWASEQLSAPGDLRAYLAVQFLPMLLVPAGLLLRLRAPAQSRTSDWIWWSALALYAGAKATEMGDLALYEQLGGWSGHAFKHLLAAGAAACLLGGAVRSFRSAARAAE